MDPEETYHMLTKGIKKAFKKTAKLVDSMETKIKIKIKGKAEDNDDISKYQPNKNVEDLRNDIMFFEGGE